MLRHLCFVSNCQTQQERLSITDIVKTHVKTSVLRQQLVGCCMSLHPLGGAVQNANKNNVLSLSLLVVITLSAFFIFFFCHQQPAFKNEVKSDLHRCQVQHLCLCWAWATGELKSRPPYKCVNISLLTRQHTYIIASQDQAVTQNIEHGCRKPVFLRLHFHRFLTPSQILQISMVDLAQS